VSTPADLVEIAKLVKASPVLSEIVSMKTATLPTIGEVTNTNKLLGINGVNGIKTGTTDEAGACLLFSADITVGTQTVTLVGFVLGGDTHSELNESISDLIDSVKTGFQEVQLTEPGVSFATYTAEWGQSAQAVTAEAASTLVWSDTPISGTATVKPITTGDTGESVGSVDYVVGTQTISVPLVLDSEVSDPGFGWRLTNPTKLG
jgi:D-alanyl-D-alanine carboxypeptidase (penicillin-binding protein 5/6)